MPGSLESQRLADPSRIFRDPVSGLTHLAGLALAVVGLVLLLSASNGKGAVTVAAVAVYRTSMGWALALAGLFKSLLCSHDPYVSHTIGDEGHGCCMLSQEKLLTDET